MAEHTAGVAGDQEPGALTIEEAAARHGAYAWLERRLFELTGSWAAAPGLADGARILLFEASGQHAWHAELWGERLPVLAGVDRDALTRPVGRAAESLLAGLAPPGTPGADADAEAGGRRFLVGLARVVLPLLLASYRGFARQLVPVADGPAIRALTLVLSDEEVELAAAEAAVGSLLAGPEAAQEAAEWTRGLGDLVGAQDGLFPWSEANFAW